MNRLALIVLPCALLLGACSCAPVLCDGATPLLLRRGAYTPPNYVDSYEYPLSVDLVTEYTSIPAWERTSPIVMERSRGVAFDWGTVYTGHTYVAVKASCSWSAGVFTLESVEFACFSSPTFYTVSQYVGFPYVFSPLSINGNYYVYENSYAIPSAINKFASSSFNVFGYGSSSSLSPRAVYNRVFTSTNSGPYDVSMNDCSSWLDNLEPILCNSFMVNAPDYTNGYNKGYAAGYQDINQGKIDQAYQNGYTDGAGSTSSHLTSLFGAVVGVPISLLNGLSPFVIWNIPIISIMVTFLFFGIALFIFKKFLSQ